MILIHLMDGIRIKLFCDTLFEYLEFVTLIEKESRGIWNFYYDTFRRTYTRVWWKNWRGLLMTARLQKKMMLCAPRPRRQGWPAGACNCNWRWTHFFYYTKNTFSYWCKSVKGSRRPSSILLFGTGPEMFSFQSYWITFQD